ncbi:MULTISPECIES: hypothetical protein [Bradyrhizobium]|uniref:Uncharacterized protein n=3 Tax=Bradyrhizobium TaxID=374 RepID=A0A9X1RAL4_9BRAD|nr:MULTISPECIES: hypothetical protein [Bradyrhizobium]MCG2628062.1 hypothetical protein [Bradyrhizobium zhengyangense]MCG2643181.1 hypothetical protein [Bradyrhizobium zhengyangense]MCG2670505.1 hypothetical protein [Bradyrhizobium zhengyangense]MDN4985760.1 hypothetical protein [Bradyrhizobium sp. WYCCWR 13022]MDT4736601.1 hypothetical protein [Bradyrhizobium sp. WYCCWR 12699]
MTMVAVLCQFASADCVDKIVTSSAFDSTLTFQGCVMNGQTGLAQWKEAHPIYRSDTWHIQRHKCMPGDYNIAHHKA